jgi:hypothetical protein
LLKREREYSKYRELKALIVSWNVDSSRPDALTGDPPNCNFLVDVLKSVDAPDIISFGLQEVIDLENRKLAAKSMLLSKKKDEEGLSQHISSAYKKWNDYLILSVRMALGPESQYTVHSENLVGLFTCVFVRRSEQSILKDLSIKKIKRGLGGRHGNKASS